MKQVFPNTIKPSILCIAHRGASSLAPENTLLAAQKALALGADLWELDVTMTRDGVTIVFHDDTPERITNIQQILAPKARWPVYRLTFEELRNLDCGSWFNQQDPFQQIAAGNVSLQEQAAFVGLPLLTFQEALEFTKANNWRVNVELKDVGNATWSDLLIERVIRQVRQSNMADSVLISSFNPVHLQRVKAISRRIETALLIETPIHDPVTLLRKLNTQAYHPSAEIVKPELIADLRARGFEVNVWTINDVEMMKACIQAGVSGIITDFPQMLNQLQVAYSLQPRFHPGNG